MNSIHILLVGNVGQIGWELQRCLPTLGKLTAVDRPTIELSNEDSIRQIVRQHSPDLIINASAYTAVDKAEEEPDLARAVNATAPAVLAEEAKRLGAAFITYSTDYVFDGSKSGAYTETDQPHPLSVYGKTKLEGDLAVQAAGGSHIIFRTSWVYGARGKNFLLTMLKLLREREVLKIVDDQIGAPTWSRSIAEATAQIIAQQLRVSISRPGTSLGDRFVDVSGVYNMTAGQKTSWFGFTQWMAHYLSSVGKNGLARLVPIGSEEYPTPAKRPRNSILDNSKLRERFGVQLPDWDEAATQVMDEILSKP